VCTSRLRSGAFGGRVVVLALVFDQHSVAREVTLDSHGGAA
jgi:hypothetical protein